MLPHRLIIGGNIYKIAGKQITITGLGGGICAASGDTFHVKDLLKDYGLKKWDGIRKEWVGSCPNVDGLIKALGLRKIRVVTQGKIESSKSKPAANKIYVVYEKDIYEDRVRVYGSGVFAIKDDLKEIGLRWKPDKKEWYSDKCPPTVVIELLKDMGLAFTEKQSPWPYGGGPKVDESLKAPPQPVQMKSAPTSTDAKKLLNDLEKEDKLKDRGIETEEEEKEEVPKPKVINLKDAISLDDIPPTKKGFVDLFYVKAGGKYIVTLKGFTAPLTEILTKQGLQWESSMNVERGEVSDWKALHKVLVSSGAKVQVYEGDKVVNSALAALQKIIDTATGTWADLANDSGYGMRTKVRVSRKNKFGHVISAAFMGEKDLERPMILHLHKTYSGCTVEILAPASTKNYSEDWMLSFVGEGLPNGPSGLAGETLNAALKSLGYGDVGLY